MISKTDKIFVAGHRGFVGSALVRGLVEAGYSNLLLRSRNELDLLDGAAVAAMMRKEKPRAVLLAAARVGGILANNRYRWEFLYENLAIQTNVLSAARVISVDRLVFLGSSCIYPRNAPQPIREEYLLTGPLEETNEPYAIAKIAGLKLVEAAVSQFKHKWVSLMPTNLYGPGDNFELQESHVLPAMIRKFHEAKTASTATRSVTLWGTGAVRREFLHVDDLASAVLNMLKSDLTGLFNVGYGDDLTIAQTAALVAKIVGYHGDLLWDRTKPDGTPRKLLDSSRIRATGWSPKISLEEGLGSTYRWYTDQRSDVEPAAVTSP